MTLFDDPGPAVVPPLLPGIYTDGAAFYCIDITGQLRVGDWTPTRDWAPGQLEAIHVFPHR